MSQCLELSFVEAREDGNLNFWSVDHSGDYQEQFRRGSLMALEALELMARDEEGAIRHHLLGWVVLDMAPVGKDKTVALGFMVCIGEFAVAARKHSGGEWYRRWLDDTDAKIAAILASEKSRRSEQARHAANARWAKARAGEASP